MRAKQVVICNVWLGSRPRSHHFGALVHQHTRLGAGETSSADANAHSLPCIPFSQKPGTDLTVGMQAELHALHSKQLTDTFFQVGTVNLCHIPISTIFCIKPVSGKMG